MKLVEKTNVKPIVHYDQKKDILYIVAKQDEEEEFIEIANDINLELNDEKEVIGIEIFNASKFFKPLVKKFSLSTK